MFLNSLYILPFTVKVPWVIDYIYCFISSNVSPFISFQSCSLCFNFKGTELQKAVAKRVQPTSNSASGRLFKTWKMTVCLNVCPAVQSALYSETIEISTDPCLPGFFKCGRIFYHRSKFKQIFVVKLWKCIYHLNSNVNSDKPCHMAGNTDSCIFRDWMNSRSESI